MVHKGLGVSRDVESIDFPKSGFEFLSRELVVDWYNSSSSTLQELYVRHLDVLSIWKFVRVVVTIMVVLYLLFNLVVLIHHYIIVFHDWLGKNSHNGDIGFRSHMVPSTNHLGLGGHNFVGTKFNIGGTSTVYR